MTTADLIHCAQQNDAAAWESIVGEHQEAVFRLAYLLLGNAAEAEDVAQDAFIRAFQALHHFDPSRPLRPWLLRIVANQAVSGRRAAARRGALAERYGREAPTISEPSPEAMALRHERREAVLAGLGHLGPDDQLVLYLRYFLDLGEAEVATVLQCARGTVKSRLHRALGRLRPLLAQAFPELARTSEGGQEVSA